MRRTLVLLAALAGVARAEPGAGPRLGERIARGDLAALRTAPARADAWTLLPVIADRLAIPEAARAAARIARALRADPLAASAQDIDADVLARTDGACATVALAEHAPAAARADALVCAVELGERPLAYRLLNDPEPEVRQAAVALLAAGATAADLPALRAAAGDPDVTVAATAAAVLCGLRDRSCSRRSPRRR